MRVDYTPTTMPYLPDYLTVEFFCSTTSFGGTYGIRFITFEQEWLTPIDMHLTKVSSVSRSVKDIKQFEGEPAYLSSNRIQRQVKKLLRSIVAESNGAFLEKVNLSGCVSMLLGKGDAEPRVTIDNVRADDHTLPMVEFSLRHMIREFTSREYKED